MAHTLTETTQQQLLDQTINDFFERSIQAATAIDPSYRHLWETLYGLIRSGGKRLRPHMTILAYETFGGKDSELIMPVAAAQELLHFSLLIHDDVIDRDYTRYGTLNIAGTYKALYQAFLSDDADRTHFAHSAAILAGDLMLSSAHQLIASSKLTESQMMTAQQLLSRSVFEVAGGELLDTELSFTPYSDGDALTVARYKTASYSFATPLLTGAHIAGISSSDASTLNQFAISLGIAYQLVDDLLGVFGEEETTGKSTSSDIVEGKRTYMVEQAVGAMTVAQNNRFTQLFGKHNLTTSEIEEVKLLLISSGAKRATENEITHYATSAHEALLLLKLSEKHQEEFEKLIKKVTERAF